jgi:DNA relaxase NicK
MLETCHGGDFDWVGLFDELVYHGEDVNISRLDIAGDDKDEILSIPKLVRHTQLRKYISKARRCVWIDGDEQEILFGATSSSTRLRIYNKALERGVDGHWIRAEFQLRDKSADSFIANLLHRRDIGLVYGGVLLNYLRYTVSDPAESNNHYDEIETVGWWSKFVCTAEKIKISRSEGLSTIILTLNHIW